MQQLGDGRRGLRHHRGGARLASLADGASIEIFATLGATIVLGAGGALLLGAHEAASIALRQAGRVYVVDGYD